MRKNFIRQILVGLFLLGVIAGTLNFGIFPQFNSFQERITEADRVDTLTGIELDELGRLQELAKLQPAIELQLVYLEDAIPLDVEISSFVDILDELAARNAVEINFLKIDLATAYVPPEHVAAEGPMSEAIERVGERLNGIPVDFSVTGTYANLVAFMDELQQSPRTTLIQDVSLSSTSGTRAYSLSLRTLIYSIGLIQEED